MCGRDRVHLGKEAVLEDGRVLWIFLILQNKEEMSSMGKKWLEVIQELEQCLVKIEIGADVTSQPGRGGLPRGSKDRRQTRGLLCCGYAHK